MDALTPTQATAVATMVLTLKVGLCQNTSFFARSCLLMRARGVSVQVYATICIQGYMGVLGGSRPPEDVSLFPDVGQDTA